MPGENSRGVVVQCPNPAGGLECLLRMDGRGENSGLRLFIRAVNGDCCYGHCPGQEVALADYQGQAEAYDTFDLIFPWLVYGAASKRAFDIRLNAPSLRGGGLACVRLRHNNGISGLSGVSACSPFGQGAVTLKAFHRRCRYHKRPIRDNYDFSRLTTPGLCPDLFHVVYPSVLARIYEGGLRVLADPAEEEFVCPQSGASVRLRLRRRPRKAAGAQVFALNALRMLGRYADWPFYDIIMEIVDGSPSCPRGHKPGQRFLLNLGSQPTLCPAAFDVFYPFWHSLMRGGRVDGFVGAGCGASCRVQCPDTASGNIYESAIIEPRPR